MPALRHSASERLAARGCCLPSSSPNTMRMNGAGLADHAGLGDGGADIGDAAHHRLLAQDRRQPLGAHRRRSAAGSRRCPRPTIGLIASPALSTSHSFTQNSTTSTGPTVAGIVGRLRRHEMRVAARALDLEALALHGREMRAAGDEGDVGARLGQRRAKAAADAARSDYRDTHRTLPITIRPALQVATAPSASSILRPPSGLQIMVLVVQP